MWNNIVRLNTVSLLEIVESFFSLNSPEVQGISSSVESPMLKNVLKPCQKSQLFESIREIHPQQNTHHKSLYLVII